ncbi:sterol esterase [Pseudomassariella vexata]|uniref:Sterol esterase n=1 Tax=Pseudomassariella vexata TaxID=1141098 RepID=A0A1Y2E4K5_9PEZI|nr:sterol esterase [Pseudomassariella vexata]ORY66284.1 sterol esterase [Pseudomassariella vexata]
MGDAVEERQVDTPPLAKSGSQKSQKAVEFAQQAEKLSHQTSQETNTSGSVAVEAQFVTPHDPVIVTADGNRLPTVPLPEAQKLNFLKEELHGQSPKNATEKNKDAQHHGATQETNGDPTVNAMPRANGKAVQKSAEAPLQRSTPPSHTNPLFPPLPLYGPASLLRDLQCTTFRVSSFFLSAGFLGVIVLGALFTNIPIVCRRVWSRITLRDPDASRPFYKEEIRRKKARQEMDKAWKRRRSQDKVSMGEENPQENDGFEPREGGPDPVVCDVGYYARRVGLDVEEIEVQTEDGFIIDLWHVYNPKEYTKLDDKERSSRGPTLFTGDNRKRLENPKQKPKFPVLLMHGLLQSSGAYCVNDEDSLAFYLCKSGYDVWLGNNRCGFKPKHALLDYSDPRMWCWNIRQMGVFDLPALTSRVLYETGFEKIGLVCHSQGTTQTFVVLAKEQRPELGEKLTVFCALAPAAYAGPLIGKMYFKFMRIITPAMFRLMFGIHAFIPIMMMMHGIIPASFYGWLGYKVFSFLFDWSDTRWDRGLKNRMFQFAPVYVSAESMRWWLGRECFAKHKCILLTKEEARAEDREDAETDGPLAAPNDDRKHSLASMFKSATDEDHHKKRPKGSTAWYNSQVPPFALWVAGKDDLVDGRKLLKRFERGREPHVKVVHSKVLADYEHLDVIWAMDAVDEIFCEVREVLWKTCNVRDQCRVPRGCEDIPEWIPPVVAEVDPDEVDQSSSDSSPER